MAINPDYQAERKRVEWQGQFVADARGLTVNDIVKILSDNPAQIEEVFVAFEKEARIAPGDMRTAAEIAAYAEKESRAAFTRLIASSPDLVARVLAAACDSPELWKTVRDQFTIPVQLELATEIARLTFVDPPGFKRFVGNVMALIGAFNPKADQGLNPALSNG